MGGTRIEQPQAPAQQATFTPTITRYGGKDVSKSYKEGDNIINEYIQTPEEKAQDEWRKTQISQYEPKINVFEPSLQQSWQDKAKATQEKTIQGFEDLYKPMERNTRNDFFSRLGTLDSTAYLDRAQELDKNRQQTYADASRQAILDQDMYKNDELGQRYQYLNYLQGGVNNATENQFRTANQGFSNSMNASNMYNNYTMQRYNALANMYQSQVQQKVAEDQKKAAMWQAAGQAAGSAAMLSDIKTKQNIKPIGNIKGINFYEYEYKQEYNQPTGKHFGVIAQEVENIIPNSVIEIDGIKHVDYSKVFERVA